MSELQRRLRAEQSSPRFEPCLPRPAKEPPSGPGWIHEIKHDGFRIMGQRRGYQRRPALHAEWIRFSPRAMVGLSHAVESLSVRSCFIDGEAIVV